MAKGYFQVSRDQTNKQDIHFQQITLQPQEAIPDDQLELRDKVDSSLTTIRILFGAKDAQFEQYFRPLLSLAQLGLVGSSANPALAQRALLSLQNEILVREGGVIKNEYMKRLGVRALWLGLIPVIVALGLQWIESQSPAVGFLYLWAGCMAGVWLSFGTRNVVIKFEELGILEKDRLNPTIRLLFAGLLTIVIGLIIATQAVKLELGDLSTTKFVSDPSVALLIGAFCGISELALSSKISQHAKDFLGVQ